MELKWEEEAKGLPLEEQWHKLFQRNSKTRGDNKAIWNGGGIPEQNNILSDIFKEFNIRSFLDCGCADHHWLSKFDWDGIDYTGIDIVPELIEKNRKNFPDKKFMVGNLTKFSIPKSDMVFIRDVFTHSKLGDIKKIIENIKESGSTYLMASTSETDFNNETSCIIMMPRNLMIEPFNFPDPVKFIEDKGKEGHIMGIWRIEQL
jgi:SAM-dependent methyltransferase